MSDQTINNNNNILDPPTHIIDGRQEWRVNGKPHRDGDLPARVWDNGRLEWWVNGIRHREGDQPAIIDHSGIGNFADMNVMEWWHNGELHRSNDMPAVIWEDGQQEWHKRGKRHREDDKPAMVGGDNSKVWYIDGKCGRLNKELPSRVLANGEMQWFYNDKLHRDGIFSPAIIYGVDTETDEEYYKGGRKYMLGELISAAETIVRAGKRYLACLKMHRLRRLHNVNNQLRSLPSIGCFPGGIWYIKALNRYI